MATPNNRSIAILVCALLASCAREDSLAPLPAAETAVRSQSPGYHSLYRFAGAPRDGANPSEGLLSSGGAFYGTTVNGGANDVGTVYTISGSGAEHVLYSFPAHDNGKAPQSPLIALHGALYGTTFGGGGTDCAGGCGTVFKIGTSGKENVIYAFTGGNDGQNPFGGVLPLNGKLYGTTTQGGCGTSSCGGACNCGSVFSIDGSGFETQVHRFSGSMVDGAYPQSGLTYSNGAFYGVTLFSVFSVTPKGAFRLLHLFSGQSDGRAPMGAVAVVNGTVFGTTTAGGGTGCGGNGCGTVFKVSAPGHERVLYRFKGGSDGRAPVGGLLSIDGLLYGTTTLGGGCSDSPAGCGTIFSVNPASGAERVLYRFKGDSDGASPGRGTLIDVGGALYGTTAKGGANNGSGTVFKIVP
jgi:uncharacterized repeat protein (TIGR03803 family)